MFRPLAKDGVSAVPAPPPKKIPVAGDGVGNEVIPEGIRVLSEIDPALDFVSAKTQHKQLIGVQTDQ